MQVRGAVVRTVAEGAKALIVVEEEEVETQQKDEEKKEEETYEERHRRRTRRSSQRYPSSPESGEVYIGKGKVKAKGF
jgi:hypothetical protein